MKYVFIEKHQADVQHQSDVLGAKGGPKRLVCLVQTPQVTEPAETISPAM